MGIVEYVNMPPNTKANTINDSQQVGESVLQYATRLVNQGLGHKQIYNTQVEYVEGFTPISRTAKQIVNASKQGLEYLESLKPKNPEIGSGPSHRRLSILTASYNKEAAAAEAAAAKAEAEAAEAEEAEAKAEAEAQAYLSLKTDSKNFTAKEAIAITKQVSATTAREKATAARERATAAREIATAARQKLNSHGGRRTRRHRNKKRRTRRR